MNWRESDMATGLKLISHKLCPYVQRAVIALSEKGVPFERIDIDLADKPDWFLALSPLGKTPVLQVGDTPIFESAVILEYLEETQPNPLHPAEALRRAEHRAWIEFGSAVLSDIAGFYAALDEATSQRGHCSSNSGLRGSKTALRHRPGSTALSRWSMRCSARYSAISMCSMASPISGYWPANRSLSAGAKRWPRGRRYVPRSAPTIHYCCATSWTGGIRGCRGYSGALPPDIASRAQRTLASRMSR
jgi:Glutathione S-transferase, N-terminal domain